MRIDINNIVKNFGEKQVLKGVSLGAESGKPLGLLGRNGAGKTTTIRIIMGVFGADSGEILVDGAPINHKKIRIGYLPEERGMYPKRLIIDQLVYFGMLKGATKSEAIKASDYYLKRLDMQEYRGKKLETLSKGNQQKIQLASTLIANPDVVILDEPFSGLDPVNAIILKELVTELTAQGKAVIFSSHQMNYIEEFCNDIVILSGGNVVLNGEINKIKRGYDRSKILITTNEKQKVVDSLSYNTQIDQAGVLVMLDDPSDKHRLISDIATLKLDIDGVRVVEPSLNDIFVQYTDQSI